MEIEKWVTLVVGMICLTSCYTVYITQTKADGLAFGTICTVIASLATYIFTQKLQNPFKQKDNEVSTENKEEK